MLALLGLYGILDPFKVLWPHANYYPVSDQFVMLNRDVVSFEVYRKNAPVHHYDSFILGNSRSIFYPWRDWAACIGSDRVLHFDASSESLLGIDLKLRYLDGRCAISNCLIVLDSAALGTVTNQAGHLFTKHYLLAGGNAAAFQWKFLRAFLDRHFLTAYFDMKLRHTYKPYMQDIFQTRVWDYDVDHNELSLDSTIEREIRTNPRAYYTSRTNVFYPRDGVVRYSPIVVGQRQLELLSDMRNILEKHRTNYRIVISPHYNQVSLAREDLAVLRQLFGADKVFDFSGVNEFTSHVENYYEDSHYRPEVARGILREIYQGSVVNLSAREESGRLTGSHQ